MDINLEIQKATDKFIAEKLPEMVAQKVTKMVDDILNDVFRSYSDVGKDIKEKIEKQLNVNLQEYDLVDYNHFVAKAINERLIGIINEGSIKPIMELVEGTLGFIEKKEIKLTEIHQMFIESSMEDNDQEAEGEISFFATKNEKYNWVTVSIDTDGGKDEDKCAFQFIISKDTQRIFSIKAETYWSTKSNLTPARVVELSNLEHKIFRLYSAQVKIEVDQMDFEDENSWSRYN